MTGRTWLLAWPGLMTLGLATGCGRSEPDIKPDPTLASKPFPTVDSPGDKAKPRASSFPGVNAAGDRKAP